MEEKIKVSGKLLQSAPKLQDPQHIYTETKHSQSPSTSKYSDKLVGKRILDEQCSKEIQLKHVQEQLQFLREGDGTLRKDKMELRSVSAVAPKLTKLQLQCLTDEELNMYST
uniref:Uncharacterized protein n=1 Tax=Graphocephala atropunctata TaxID=36148 RepID=A0A1B6MNH6_9HEMI